VRRPSPFTSRRLYFVSPDTPIGGIVWVVGDVEVCRKHVDDLTRLDTGLSIAGRGIDPRISRFSDPRRDTARSSVDNLGAPSYALLYLDLCGSVEELTARGSPLRLGW
jgi:hypothetical protein